MSRTVVFVHGGWVTPRCWDPFVSYFEARGYRCLAPAWPGKDRAVEEIRRDPSALAGLGIRDIVDRYEQVVRSLDEPPIVIGHSFGGLFAQILLDRGLGAAGVVIDSAAPKGVFTLEPTSLVSNGRILAIPFGWRKVVHWTFAEFRYAFVHTLPLAEAKAIWNAQIVPDSGRPFFEAGLSMFDRHSPAKVDFSNPNRAPLLIVAGLADRALPPVIARRTLRAYGASPAQTDLRTFPGRTHWIIAQPGWEEVAQSCIDWLESLPNNASTT
ncbi:MAG TPA: alpha/beta hydrolase [Candidatus Acidoferrales bacterium]|nr:alpha/beta hydrolase [Candidatus Acidoferrales bacterium]